MATGLQVWKDDGTLLIDTSTSVALMLGQISIGGENTPQSGTVVNDRFRNGRPYSFMLLGGIPGVDNKEAVITFNDNTMTWRYPDPDGSTTSRRPRCTIMYGTF